MEGTYEKITKIGIGILLLSFIVLIGYLKINAYITQNDQEKTLTSKKVKQEDLKTNEQVIIDGNWINYFNGLNGSAVICDPSANQYQIYNQELAHTRQSPCSTFKIISSLIGLENGIIDP